MTNDSFSVSEGAWAPPRSGRRQDYRLISRRVICANKSSNSSGNPEPGGVCGRPRPSMCAATYLPSLFARCCRSSCFLSISRRAWLLVPIMQIKAAAIRAAATMPWPCHRNHAAQRGSAMRRTALVHAIILLLTEISIGNLGLSASSIPSFRLAARTFKDRWSFSCGTAVAQWL